MSNNLQQATSIFCRLTAREFQILSYYLCARSAKEIANSLHLSVRTVEKHIDNIRGKFKSTKKSDLFDMAIREGMLSKLIGAVDINAKAAA